MRFRLRGRWANTLLMVSVFIPPLCRATSAVVVVTPYGVVIGIDSKIVRDRRVRGPPVPQDKAVIVQDRLVVAIVGEVNFAAQKGKERVEYKFEDWIQAIKGKCPQNMSVFALTSLIESVSRSTFRNYDRFVRAGAFERDNSIPIQYLVAGYDSGIPNITRVYFEIDWAKLQLKGPEKKVEHPNANSKVDFDFLVDGQNDIVKQLANRESGGYKEMLALAPNEIPKLVSGKNLTLIEGRKACRAALRYETNHHKDKVGPPYVIFVIPPFGMGGVTRELYPH